MLKRKSKRVLSIVLAVAMIVGLFPIAAFAEDGTATDNVVASATISGTTKTYDTFEGAVEAVFESKDKTGTVKLLQNAFGDGIVFPSGVNITIDLGGNTYDVSGSTVGSTGTETNGFQLLKNSTIVFQNGGLMASASGAKVLIQNYSNLTLNNVDLDGTSSNNTIDYVLSNNNGKTNIIGDTSIKAKASKVAFDVYNWPSGSYTDGAQVVVNTTGTIAGKIEVTKDNTEGESASTLDIKNIVHEGDFFVQEGLTEKCQITGGSFTDKENVKNCIVEGNTLDENGQVVVDTTTAVASVNNVGYTSLQDAIDAAKDNGTVTLVNNVNLTDGVEVEGTVTLDLNGYTITNADDWTEDTSVDYLLAVKRGGNLKINDSSANKTGAITTENDKIAVAVKLTIKGEDGEGDAATLTVNGGTLKAPFYGISGNGTRHKTELTINGGTIKGTKGTGIYQPQDGTVTINGGTITGLTGIEIRSGQLDVNGGTFISTAEKYEEAENGGGTTVTGAAIAVSQHTTDKIITVTVDGGTLEGPKSFVETGVQKPPVKGSSATINNGTFVGEVSSDDLVNIVKGGQFSAPVLTNLLDDTLTAQLQSTSNTTAPYSYYTSVEAAIAAAQPGDKVVDLNATSTTTNYIVTIKYNNGDKDLTLKVLKNTELTLPAAPSRADYTFDGWIINGERYAAGAKLTITADTEISADWQPQYTGKYSYEIFTKVGENGTISVDRYATEGDNVTITVSPDEAYLLDELTVTAGGKEVEVKDNGDGTYTFKMPSADAKIVVTFAEDPDWEPEPEEPAMPFTDVNENDWFYDVVLYAYDNGLMTGVSATEFAPNQTTTRGMIVSMLARLEGVTSAEDAGFADVAANDWYATAVNWAASVGVVNGYEDNTFRPNDAITREQMAAILYNYADYKGYDVSARADLSDYADAESISSWAEDVLAWANAEGLINGMTATTIDPQGATTRAQTAAMFERFLTAHAE